MTEQGREASRQQEIVAHFTAVNERIWSFCEPYIAEALKHSDGSNTVEDVRALWIAGKVTLWPGVSCAAVCELHQGSRKRVWRVWLAGGDVWEMRRMRPGMEAYARGCGCEAIEFAGRLFERDQKIAAGWEAASGYQPKWVQLSKEL